MYTQTAPYPLTPKNVDAHILEPSANFKREAVKVLCAIFFFIFVYLILIAVALGLAALCALGGLGLIILKPMIITIMLGAGLAGLGVMVVFFLLKFLFKSHKVDRSGLIETREHEQPALFQFIRTLANETQTPFPKKIYLSPDVNASVFYNSTFWSMFFPVRKNLQIGLGLVNAVNLSEFKAIIAHEFGHFSQRSMKLGIYVYNVNQIIFNLLYDNDNYERAIERWSNASGYFAFFAMLTIKIVKGIQWILQQVYAIVNKQYMSLSRQMEFHADAVSASVSGGNHLVTSLRRLEVADTTYNNIFSFYRDHFKESLKPENIYPQHKEIMKVFSSFHDMPFEHGLPQVSADSFNRFNKSRVTIKDQWSSHPSTDDRESHLHSLKIETPPLHDSAWIIFDKQEELQKKVTEKIFEGVQFETSVTLIDDLSFRERYHKYIQRYQLPPAYKGYFDNRLITTFELQGIEKQNDQEYQLEVLLSEDVLALPLRKNGIESDLEILAVIMNGDLQVKQFEFEGRKYKAKDAQILHTQLQTELSDLESALSAADQRIVAWFLKQGNDLDREKLRGQYNELFQLTRQVENDMATYNAMNERLSPLYQTMTFQQIEKAVAELKSKETEFKERLEHLLYDPSNANFIENDQQKTASEYLSGDWQYFQAQVYNQASLERLNICLYLYYNVLNEKIFHAKAQILKDQLRLAGIS
jgi:Zn-dependent protease with chaperone function